MGNIPLQGTDTYPTKKGTSEKSIDSEKVPGWDRGLWYIVAMRVALFFLKFELHPRKTNGWIPKITILEVGDTWSLVSSTFKARATREGDFIQKRNTVHSMKILGVVVAGKISQPNFSTLTLNIP